MRKELMESEEIQTAIFPQCQQALAWLHLKQSHFIRSYFCLLSKLSVQAG